MFRCRASHWLSLIGVSVPDLVIASETASSAISPLITLARLAAALLIVLAVFWVFARIMRQAQGFSGNAHSALTVVGSLSLGQRERVVIVQAGDEQLILGVTTHQINTLHVMQQPIKARSPDESSSFKVKLNEALKLRQS